MSKTSKVRLAGKDMARLVGEDDMLVVYHCMSNDRERHASAPSSANDGVSVHLSAAERSWIGSGVPTAATKLENLHDQQRT